MAIYIIFLTVIASIISILLIRWMNKREKKRMEGFQAWLNEGDYYQYRLKTDYDLYQEFIKTKKKC